MPVQAIDVQCIREDLLNALQAAEAVVPGNNIKKILSNLCLTVGDDHMVVSATDQQIGLRALVRRLQVHRPGTVLVPARQLVGILKESGSRDVRIHVGESGDGQLLHIDLQDGQYHLPVFPSEEFPVISGFPEESTPIPVAAADLERMIRCTLFAVDKDRSSAVLSGVYCAIAEEEFLLTATDGKVLVEARRRDPVYGSLPDTSLIIPALTVNHLSRLLGSHQQGDVALAVAKNLIFVRAVLRGSEEGAPIQVEINSRLIEGVYPSYRNAIPTQSEDAVGFRSAELATGLRRTVLMTSSANRGIVMTIGRDGAMLSNLSHSTGTAEIPVPCRYDGAEQRIGMNASNLQEILRVYRREELSLELNGRGRGMIIRDDDETYLIMPITLPN
ncbi:MAG: DNA polymerase III subunit beta [Planctomycetota bacterium]